MQGFYLTWQEDVSTGRPRAKCVETPRDFPTSIVVIVAVCAVLGIIFFLLCGLLTFKRLAHKPSWLWKKEITKHRIKGPPQEGMMSVVVTDIEGYSGERACRVLEGGARGRM